MSPRPASLSAGLIVLALLVPVNAAADDDDPAIREVAAVVRDGRVYTNLTATNTLDPNSLDRLESGLPVTLEYQIEVRNRRTGWFDKALASATVSLELVYDAVTREYSVTRRVNGELFDVHRARSLTELDPRLSKLTDIPVMQIANADLGEDPVVRARLVTRRRVWLWIIPRPVASPWRSTHLILSPEPNRNSP